MSRLTRDGTAEPGSRDQIFRHARGQGNIHFPCSADHEQDWQLYPVDPYSAICDDHTYIHTYCLESAGTGPVLLKVAQVTSAACLYRLSRGPILARLSFPTVSHCIPLYPTVLGLVQRISEAVLAATHNQSRGYFQSSCATHFHLYIGYRDV